MNELEPDQPSLIEHIIVGVLVILMVIMVWEFLK